MSLTIEQILKSDDTVVRKVSCPEWGGDVFVRTFTADDRDRLESAFNGRDGVVGVRAAILSAAICNEKGEFLHPTAAESQALGKKSAGPFERCVDAIMEINSMRPGDVEKLAKNSEETESQDSG